MVQRLEAQLEEGGDCEGTAIFRLQSCANHSCSPSATATTEGNGTAVITARGDLAAGDEVTISYIDEDLLVHDRRAALQDYGFTCMCSKCKAEDPQEQ